jgi:hypothetical protein
VISAMLLSQMRLISSSSYLSWQRRSLRLSKCNGSKNNNVNAQSKTFSTVAAAALKHEDTSLPPIALPFVISGGNFKTDNHNSRPPLPQNASSFLLPTKHSRKRLPTVITDLTLLTDLAAEILSTETGRLFTYDITLHSIDSMVNSAREQPAFRSSRSGASAATTVTPQNIEKALLSATASRDVAWHTSYATVATIEALIRGCAHGIHGTKWQRWLPAETAAAAAVAVSSSDSPNNADPTDLMQLQHSLLNRLYNEGYAYMTLRSLQLTERFGEKVPLDVLTSGSDPTPGLGVPPPPLLERSGHGTLQSLQSPMLQNYDQNFDLANTSNGSGDPQRDAHLHDFALPGPTIAMYDTMLDTLASYCILLQQQQQHSAIDIGSMETTVSHVLETANYLHDVAMLRHVTDGGDATNANPYTRPTAVTFNALMRVAAELPIADGPTSTKTTLSPVVRDDAITTALATFQALHECGVVHRNNASYVYALRAVTKYLPPSRIRDNIVVGLVSQARYQGLLSVDVAAAYRAAFNVPSHSDNEVDISRHQNVTAAAALLDDPSMPPEQWPPKWKRHSRKRQYHPREAIY